MEYHHGIIPCGTLLQSSTIYQHRPSASDFFVAIVYYKNNKGASKSVLSSKTNYFCCVINLLFSCFSVDLLVVC